MYPSGAKCVAASPHDPVGGQVRAIWRRCVDAARAAPGPAPVTPPRTRSRRRPDEEKAVQERNAAARCGSAVRAVRRQQDHPRQLASGPVRDRDRLAGGLLRAATGQRAGLRAPWPGIWTRWCLARHGSSYPMPGASGRVSVNRDPLPGPLVSSMDPGWRPVSAVRGQRLPGILNGRHQPGQPTAMAAGTAVSGRSPGRPRLCPADRPGTRRAGHPSRGIADGARDADRGPLPAASRSWPGQRQIPATAPRRSDRRRSCSLP